MGSIINNNCIDCHMPRQQSHSIAVYTEGADVPTPVKMRTHYVAIYKDESNKMREFLKSGHAK
jgi:formate-dependent nitrite reductase cytochrome c552 subunit